MGGEWFETVLAQMNLFGRVSICGAISQYNIDEPKGNVMSYIIFYYSELHFRPSCQSVDPL